MYKGNTVVGNENKGVRKGNKVMRKENTFGDHYLVELIGCDPEVIKFLESTREVFLRCVKESRATYIGDVFHQFEPYGVSGVVLIAESHMSFHTWPEANYVGVDIFTCGLEMDPEVAINVLKEEFRASDVHVKTYTRGY